MADDKNKGKEDELEIEGSGKKKKLIIIIATVLLLLGGGAGYFFFMGSTNEESSQEQLDAALDSADKEVNVGSRAELGSALYVPMPRPFRFNVPGSARDRFVEIRVQLLVRGSDNEESAKKHVPLIESTLLAVFSQSNADDLSTSAGKTSLKQKSLAEVHKIMTDVEGSNIVEKVLFTGFVMQ